MTRTLLRIIEWLGILLLVAVLVAIWVAGREDTLRWAARKATEASGGTVTLEGPSGSLYGPIRLRQIRYQDADLHVSADEVTLDWEPWAILLRPHALRITALESKRVTIQSIGKSSGPPQVPADLALPLPVSVYDGAIETLAYIDGETRIEASRLRFAYEGDAGNHRLGIQHVESPAGTLHGHLALGAQPPFAASGALSLNGRYEQFPYRLRTTIDGRLEELKIVATNAEPPLQAEVVATVTPFGVVPVREATVRAEQLDLRAFEPAAPAADLAVDLIVRPRATGDFEGDFRIVNRAPGTLDRDRLPIVAAAGRFAGEPRNLALDGLELDLGPAGKLTGNGGIVAGKYQLDLRSAALNLKGLQAQLNATKLAGGLELAIEGDAQTLTVDLSQQGYRIQAEARHHAQVVEIAQARVQAKGGEVALKGRIGLSENRAFSAEGTVSRFDPAAFGAYPAALLNGTFKVSGALEPQWRAALSVAVKNSRFRGAPLSGGGKLDVSARQITGADIAFKLGTNDLSAKGSLGRPGDRLTWRVQVNEPAVLVPALSGQLRGEGVVEGTYAEPSGSFTVSGSQLRWGEDHRLSELRAGGRLARGLDGELALSAVATGIQTSGIQLDRATVEMRGKRTDHEIALTAGNPMLEASASLMGGWFGEQGWRGRIVRLDNRGEYPLSLVEPTTLELASDRVVLGAAQVRLREGVLRIAGVRRTAGELVTSGDFTGIPVAMIARLAGAPTEGAKITLVLGGRWDLNARERLNGTVEVFREQGDVAFGAAAPVALGLSLLALNARADDNRITVSVEAAGSNIGTVRGAAETVASRRDRAWGIAGNAPLKLDARANIPSVQWLQAFASDEVTFRGRVDVAVTADGTVTAPNLRGTVTGDGLEVGFPAQGVYLARGTLKGSFEENRFVLEELLLRGGDGTLTLSGVYELGRATGLTMQLRADRLEPLSRPGQQLMVSGGLDGSVEKGQFKAHGKLTVDRARIEVLPRTTRTLPDDIVVKGREEPEERAARNFAELDLEIDLGPDFRVNAYGLDARLIGNIVLRARERDLPTARGSIRVAQGYYTAFGQRLTIDRGILTFNGPIDSAALNVLALRKNQAVEAGVSVTGTLREPVVKLYSVPDVPDPEKLSWLILGRPPDPNARDNEALRAAAASVLAEGGASLFGLSGGTGGIGVDAGIRDEGGTTGHVMSVGKRISDNVYLAYERSVSGSINLTKVRYVLSPRWLLQASTGTDNALDVFFTLFFD